MTLMVKNLPAMQETWVLFLGQEDPLEKEVATCSSILAWRFPWAEEPGGLQSMGSKRVRGEWATKHFHTFIHNIYMMLSYVFMRYKYRIYISYM